MLLVVPSDAVFDRRMLEGSDGCPIQRPLEWMSAEKIQASDPHTLLGRLERGQAQSGTGFALRVTDDRSWSERIVRFTFVEKANDGRSAAI